MLFIETSGGSSSLLSNASRRSVEEGLLSSAHVSVMLEECVHWLVTDPRGSYLDATLGLGGHAEGMLARLETGGRILGLDLDPESLALATERLAGFADRFKGVIGNFRDAARLARESGFAPLSGALFDLGISSYQLATAARGLSFLQEGPLDMRLSPHNPLTASQIINAWPEEQLALLLKEYGEERRADKIARMIVTRRKLKAFQTTTELASEIERVAPRISDIHPATKTFLALRIAVNTELENLTRALESVVEILKPGGRLLVIAFHSLEDRIVKRLFASSIREGHCRYVEGAGKKPISPSRAEIAANPRSRSAKLRMVEKI